MNGSHDPYSPGHALDSQTNPAQEPVRLELAVVERLRSFGTEEDLKRGVVLYEEGERLLDFHIVLRGRLETFERKQSGSCSVLYSLCPGCFTGEMDLLNNRQSLLGCRAAKDTSILRIPRSRLRELLRAESELGEIVLLECISRRATLLQHGQCALTIIGDGQSSSTLRVLHFLTSIGYPHKAVDPAKNREAATLLQVLELGASDLPTVFLPRKQILRNPTNTELAESLGMMQNEAQSLYDCVVVGAGPSGLAAAVYAASEGLRTAVIETHAPGGQAGTSSKIENYLGFPTGISGRDLAARAEIQAQRFGAELVIATAAVQLSTGSGVHRLLLSDGRTLATRAVVIASGARYRTLSQEQTESSTTHCIHHAATAIERNNCRGEQVVVVGGGNSAGQAALFLAGVATHVHLIVRGTGLRSTMSNYLLQRIQSSANISIRCRQTIISLGEESGRHSVTTQDETGTSHRICARNVFVMIGADPNTEWLEGEVQLDASEFIVTGHDVSHPTSAYETSRPGIFAVGDVRSGSVKRVASASGEGAAVIADVHRYLGMH